MDIERSERGNSRSFKGALMLVALLVSVMMLPMLLPSPASAAPAASASTVSVDGSTIALGAPTESAPVALPGLLSSLGCALNPICNVKAVLNLDNHICGIVVTIDTVNTFGTGAATCTKDAGNAAKAAFQLVLTPAMHAIMSGITYTLRESVKQMNLMVLGEFSSTSTIFDPVVDCNNAAGKAKAECGGTAINKSTWFVSEVSLMRQIALLLVMPLLMITVIQSVIRGSLYFLLRSFLVMLPIAIIGTVAVITLTQLMINISNLFSDAMINNLKDSSQYTANFNKSIDNMTNDTLGGWAILWCIVFLVGAVAVFVELLIRSIGIYLATLFLPLAFAGLVWPSTGRWARRLIEILLGLIFSKFFIAAALTLGMVAIAGSNRGISNLSQDNIDSNQIVQGSTGNVTQQQYGNASLYAGASMIIMAAFAGGRVLSLTPSATAHAERFTSGSRLLSMGAMTNLSAGWANTALNRRN